MDSPATELAVRETEVALSLTREGAMHLSEVLDRTAMALERSAELANEHAERQRAAGRTEDAAKEYGAAGRAREAAERARCQAAEWRHLVEPRKQ